MKKIIVPVDFSKHSEDALKTAAFIAKKQNAEIIAVHMLELSNAIISQSESYSQQEAVFYLKLAEKKFIEFLNKEYLKEIKVTPIIKHYKIFSELNALAKEENAELIVMGSHGIGGLKEIFVGSNTEKVVRNSSVPVLVTKDTPILSNLENAVFACDFTNEDIKPYQEAKKLLSKLGCKLHLLHVNTPYGRFKSTKETQKKVVNFLTKANETLETLHQVQHISDYTVESGILEYANQHNMDLIVIATHGRKGLSHFFEGSISEDIANHANLPVMTFKI
ncbi:nucleotide-binding universal stress UspA family protein [Tenacibaculum adriaticum]|uniref:Nucleotide-binding universal stress UspA family protein n=1 Tax=Tenacibaculum adriaticum TaxID=413713 RepID=A0A5S5DN56_9FLAO|nr:universal stress protein [Tenacibaculum adriaticum]TYP97380.1 nucleotide-binding universal stress UspA family protein [Tenacibaculum adriaticum]